LPREIDWTAGRAAGAKVARVIVARLRSKKTILERDDLLHFVCREVTRGLCMSPRGVVCLSSEVLTYCRRHQRFTAIPHHGAEETQVRRGQRPSI